MGKVRNILFIMADQLRWDYLSCYGHPHLKTPNIDSIAKKVDSIPLKKRTLTSVFKATVFKKPSLIIDVMKAFSGV